ncbi:MAG: D-glycero-alpha-D-manno-heptose-1,7-bisphosphate 7-phosphatase [Isosphaeraceae bacterium]
MTTPRTHALLVLDGSRPETVGGRTFREIWSTALAKAGALQVRVASGTDPQSLATHADLAEGADVVLIVGSGYLIDVDLGKLLADHRASGRALTVLQRADGHTLGGIHAFRADAYRDALTAGEVTLSELSRGFDGTSAGWSWEGVHIDLKSPEGREAARTVSGRILSELLRPTNPGGRRAVFLDRDGTINVDVHYLSDPRRFRLLPGAAGAIRRLRQAGLACVVVTNQSGIGRGMYSLDQLGQVHEEMLRQLSEEGTTVDAIYACAEAPTLADPDAIEFLDRKPGPGMLYRGASDLGIDLGRSWMVGDTLADLGAGRNAGCRGVVLVRTGRAPEALRGVGPPVRVVDHLAAAADEILAAEEADHA